MQLRQVSDFLIVSISVLLIQLVTLSGASANAQTPQQRPYAGIVNGDTIWLDDFSREVGRKAELYETVGSMNPSDIMEQTWNEIVMAVLLRQRAQTAGLTPTPAEIDSVLLSATPDFVMRGVVDDKGRFDKPLLLAMALNPDSLVEARGQKLTAQQRTEQAGQLKASMSELRSKVGHQLMLKRLKDKVTDTLVVDTTALRKRYQETSTTALVDLLYFPCPNITQEPTRPELEAYFESHSPNYTTTTEMRRMAMLTWPLVAAPVDSNLFLANIKAWIELLNKAKSAHETDSVWNEVASTIASGSTTLHPDSATHKQFYEACQGKKKGTAVGPFILSSGVHVLLVDSVFSEKGKKGKRIAIRVAITDIPPSKETVDSTLREVEVAVDMYDRGTVLNELATKFHKQIVFTPFFNSDTKIYDSYRLVDVAFQAHVRAATEPVDASALGIVFGVVTDSIPPGPLPLDAAVASVKADMQRELACKSIESVVKGYAGIVAVLEDGRMLVPEPPKGATILRDVTITMDGLIGESIVDPLAASVICGSATSGLMNAFRGDVGWYVVNVKSVSKARDEEFPMFMKANGQGLVDEQRSAYWEVWKSTLIKQSVIEDRRWMYFRY
ncbi:MAG: SurA N-terminal domain-containing protein [Ignavibacteria bacterium]|nr:SurA N-terminal domain-containing protein [Ignavibacteria bacterium]